MKKNLKFLFLFTLIIVIYSCEKDCAKISPEIAILGKWRYIGHEIEPEYEVASHIYIRNIYPIVFVEFLILKKTALFASKSIG